MLLIGDSACFGYKSQYDLAVVELLVTSLVCSAHAKCGCSNGPDRNAIVSDFMATVFGFRSSSQKQVGVGFTHQKEAPRL